MGIHTRVGLVAGALGFALLFIAQLLAGAAAVALALAVGLGAGLGTAKWLPRDWYGRQFAAGARAGLFACGVALGGFVLSLILAGAHTTAVLAARSHLVGIDLGPAVRTLGVVGWLGAGIVLALAAWAVGTGVAALASQVGAWDKNQHAIEVVARARAAAQQSGRRMTAAPRTMPLLYGTLPPNGGTPPTSPGSPGAERDLAGLNESWHSLRSPLNVFPPPGSSDQAWSRYDERLPPGALLPDEFALDAEVDEPGATYGEMAPGANGAATVAGASGWDDGAAGWMDYEDAGDQEEPAAAVEAAAPSVGGEPDVADTPDLADPVDGEADSWLN